MDFSQQSKSNHRFTISQKSYALVEISLRDFFVKVDTRIDTQISCKV